MARSHSNRRGRRISRVLVPVLVGGCLVFAGYFLLPDGEPAAAVQPPAPKPAVKLANRAPQNAVTEKKPAGPATRPAGEAKDAAKPAEPAAGPQTAGDALEPDGPTTRAIGPALPAAFLTQAAALENENKHFEARKVLNDALQTGRLDTATADTVKQRIQHLNQTIIFTPTRRFAEDPQQSAYTIQPGDSLVKICRELPVPHGFIARVNAVNPMRIRAGQSIKLITVPIHAVVSKKRFTMDLYLGALPGQPGSMYLTTYRVGLGEAGSTPTGTWEVTPKSKTENPAWTNPRTNESFGSDDPKNPLGERWIGLTGISGEALGAVSYGIHGTIEPDSIGKNASMGCIRLVHDDIVAVFDMLSEGRSTVLVTKD